ncbi:MAG: 30S ribosomal protein S3 [Anaerolineae bacterium]|nr:30S ribosomal protein S3 [Anaerolineae bacterium]
MGRKVHPYGFRIGVIKDWQTRWFAEGKEYKQLLAEDRDLRSLVHREIPKAGISKIEIERNPNQIRLIIHTAKPGIIIGRKGASVNALRQHLQDKTKKKVKIDVAEIERPELDALLVAESIAEQLEQRVSYKRAMKQAVTRAMRLGAQGAMITCGGRLAGSEMARRETVREGRIPRHTLRADIDFARAEALTTFGRIGVKVWIYRGEVLGPMRVAGELADGTGE